MAVPSNPRFVRTDTVGTVMRRALSTWRRWLWWGAFLVVSRAGAAVLPTGEGQPFMQHFSPRDYQAGMQCWAAVQDARGVMYVTNMGCVLEYDGSTWRKIHLEGNPVATGLSYDERTDTVFVGAVNNLGCLRT